MTTRGRELTLATRGSDLALAQARRVADALERRRFDVTLEVVETRGDRVTDELIHRLGTTGAFVRALDERVLEGDVDGAIHSLKDVPTEGAEGLELAAIPERAAAGDVLVTPDGADLEGLARGATVGTASLRRGAQLQAERPDLEIEPLRGNVDTRIAKLLAPTLQAERERLEAVVTNEEGVEESDDESDDAEPDALSAWLDDRTAIEQRALDREVDVEYDAIVLAKAGLVRAGLLDAAPTVELEPASFVPAPGQGALAVVMPPGELGEDVRSALDHRPTRVATTVERLVLAELGGGCVAPLGVHAVLKGSIVRVTARVLDRAGETEVTERRDLPVNTYAAAAREFAADLAERGAADLIAAARRENGEAGATREEPVDGGGDR